MRKGFLVALLLSVLLLIPAVSNAFTVELEKVNGYLDGEGARQSFTVYCHEKVQNLEFTQPESGADFYVKVLGQDDNFLEDFRLKDGEIIILKGGGRFSLVVHSESGDGAWSCKPVESD